MNKTYLAIGASILGAGISFYAGYLVAESKLNKLYNEQMEAEIERTKNFYMATTKPGTPADVAEALGIDFALANAADTVRKFAGKDVTIVRDGAIVGEASDELFEDVHDAEDQKLEDVLDERNLFDGDDEEKHIVTTGRSADRPYQITTLEFAENETGYDQVSVTWYAGDNILTADDDSLVDDHKCVGDHNLELFGTSQDPNIVYVRNERLQVDYEIARHTGKFAHVVQGFAHSDETYERTRRTRRSADE
jgi:hypothetical protein